MITMMKESFIAKCLCVGIAKYINFLHIFLILKHHYHDNTVILLPCLCWRFFPNCAHFILSRFVSSIFIIYVLFEVKIPMWLKSINFATLCRLSMTKICNQNDNYLHLWPYFGDINKDMCYLYQFYGSYSWTWNQFMINPVKSWEIKRCELFILKMLKLRYVLSFKLCKL